MEIIPKLNLNRNPKDIPNNSIVAAKNMVIDDTGGYFTNEPGFNVSFECDKEPRIISDTKREFYASSTKQTYDKESNSWITTDDHAGEYIVGVIPCNNEIVILTYSAKNAKSRIYRKYDDSYDAIEIQSNWEYHNGIIDGTYTYNYKKELIIVIAEHDAKDIEGNQIDVPLKTWNIDNPNINLSHNVEETIPAYNIDYNIVNGSLNCGVYTFFIRFEIDKDNYTKWFQITDDIIVINNDSHDKPIHTFLNADGSNTTTYNIPANNKSSYISVFQINGNKKSSKGVHLIINIDKLDYSFSNYQLGYIVKHDEAVEGRIYSTFNVDNNNILFLTNTYIQEESIDKFLENPHQFYNVGNVINYNNRLYIADYDEYKNEDLTYEVANYVTVNLIKEKITDNSSNKQDNVNITELKISTNFNITGNCQTYDSFAKDKYYKDSNTNLYHIKKEYFTEFIQKFFAKVIKIYNKLDQQFTPIDKDIIRNYGIGSNGEPYRIDYRFDLCIAQVNNHKLEHFLTIYNSHLKKAVYIDDIYINENKQIVIKEENSNIEYTIGGGKTNFNVYIEQYTYLRGENGYFLTTMFLPNQVTTGTYTDYFVAGYGMGSSVNEINTVYDLTIESPYNNYRTLIPAQVYNFYIHYIRKDGSFTNGYKIENKDNTGFDKFVNTRNEALFKVPLNEEEFLYFPKPIVSHIPDGYIGYFISYEKVEDNVVHCIATNKGLTNTPFEFDVDVINGTICAKTSDKTNLDGDIDKGQYLIASMNNVVKASIERHVIPIIGGSILRPTEGSKYIIYTSNKDIYNKSVKTLYRLTDNIYNIKDAIISYKYLPGFYNKEKVFYYDDELIINPTASNVLGINSNIKDSYDLKLYNEKNYSKYPLNAFSIKQDYNEGSVSLVSKDQKTLGVFYNKVLSPDRLKDFLEIKGCYTSAQSKSFTNYSTNNIDNFTKTIFRSNVISDESLVNGFRQFDAEQYKIIKENKGNITNLVGIGLYLLVHTEHSLFVFDRTNKLNNKTQLEIPDTFSIDYQEVLPANEGFGGLRDKRESIITKNGYIWFDYYNNYIFRYENGKVDILSNDINNFIKDLDIDYVRFGEDLDRNRLIICIHFKIKNSNDNNYYNVTLSYNFNSKTFISLHDYSFTSNYRTYNKSYFFDENKDRARLYMFDDKSFDYKCLLDNNNIIYPTYGA